MEFVDSLQVRNSAETMNKPDRTRQLRHIDGNRGDHSILNFAAHARHRKNAHSRLRGNGRFDRFDSVRQFPREHRRLDHAPTYGGIMRQIDGMLTLAGLCPTCI